MKRKIFLLCILFSSLSVWGNEWGVSYQGNIIPKKHLITEASRKHDAYELMYCSSGLMALTITAKQETSSIGMVSKKEKLVGHPIFYKGKQGLVFYGLRLRPHFIETESLKNGRAYEFRIPTLETNLIYRKKGKISEFGAKERLSQNGTAPIKIRPREIGYDHELKSQIRHYLLIHIAPEIPRTVKREEKERGKKSSLVKYLGPLTDCIEYADGEAIQDRQMVRGLKNTLKGMGKYAVTQGKAVLERHPSGGIGASVTGGGGSKDDEIESISR